MDDSSVDQDYPRQDRRRWTREKTDCGETMQSGEDGCDQDFAVDYLPTHAAWCDESLNSRKDLMECRTDLKECRTELKECRTELKEWMMVQALLVSKEDERNLKVKLDMAEDEVDREGQIINFYKTPNIDWARPFHAKLQGDVAIGDGVARHFLSLVIHKLKHGFAIDVGGIDCKVEGWRQSLQPQLPYAAKCVRNGYTSGKLEVIFSVKNWRNALQRLGEEVGRVLVRGLRRLLTVEKRVLGFWQGSEQAEQAEMYYITMQ
ncbi:unnamed protein product [Boreogadus saida]